MRTLIVILLAAAVTTLRFTAVFGDDIINGRTVSKKSMQYMVSVQKNKQHFCGGFLISPKYVLTAAHCAKESENLSVVLGDHNIDPRKYLERYDVIRRFNPNVFTDVMNGDDITLLKLSRKAVLGTTVRTVKIPKKQYSVKANTMCLVAGWGTTRRHRTVNELLALNVSTVDIHTCTTAWKKSNKNITKLPKNIICAGGYKENGGVCQGDSGGPLVCNSVAVGIVSFARQCKYPDVPSIYTDVSKYAQWIKEVMKK